MRKRAVAGSLEVVKGCGGPSAAIVRIVKRPVLEVIASLYFPGGGG